MSSISHTTAHTEQTPAPVNAPDSPRAKTTVANAWHHDLKRLSFWADHAAIIGLVALMAVFAALNPVFLTVGNIQSILIAASILIVLTIGQSFVILSDGIDLSVASTMTLGVIAFGMAYAQGAGLHTLKTFGHAVYTDDRHLARQTSVGDRTGDTKTHNVVCDEESFDVGVGTQQVFGLGESHLTVPVR